MQVCCSAFGNAVNFVLVADYIAAQRSGARCNPIRTHTSSFPPSLLFLSPFGPAGSNGTFCHAGEANRTFSSGLVHLKTLSPRVKQHVRTRYQRSVGGHQSNCVRSAVGRGFLLPVLLWLHHSSFILSSSPFSSWSSLSSASFLPPFPFLVLRLLFSFCFSCLFLNFFFSLVLVVLPFLFPLLHPNLFVLPLLHLYLVVFLLFSHFSSSITDMLLYPPSLPFLISPFPLSPVLFVLPHLLLILLFLFLLFRVAALLSLLVVQHLLLLLIFFYWCEFPEAKGEMKTCCTLFLTRDVCLGVDTSERLHRYWINLVIVASFHRYTPQCWFHNHLEYSTVGHIFLAWWNDDFTFKETNLEVLSVYFPLSMCPYGRATLRSRPRSNP